MGTISNTVTADKALMSGTSSIIANLQAHYSREILEGKYNATQTRFALANATVKNVSAVFNGGSKGGDTKDINTKVDDLKKLILLNGSDVAELLDNFTKMA